MATTIKTQVAREIFGRDRGCSSFMKMSRCPAIKNKWATLRSLGDRSSFVTYHLSFIIVAAMTFEVEQKFRVADSGAIARRLQDLGAQEAGVIDQLDHYFNHSSRDFAQTDEALRLRQVGDSNFITYKGPKLDATTKTRREIELPLPPGPDTLAHFTELLTALGFRPVAQVHKTRRQFRLDWQNHEVEIALDNVQGLGDFVELELTADDQTLAAAKSAIASLAAELKLTDNERRSYLELLLGAAQDRHNP
jgi:adenylate cyclase class 2